MKDWEKYESQIFGKLKKEFPKVKILKNQEIRGLFSKRIRQIDILINGKLIGKQLIGVVECKKFNKKIDVKTVEEFISFIEDVGANIGIMITNIGYTKGAINRIATKNIKLDVVNFKKIEYYHFFWDRCDLCRDEDIIQGEIIWDYSETISLDGKDVIIKNGTCSRCGESYFKCKECGEIFHIDDDSETLECYCGNIFSIECSYIGQGMTEDHVILKSKT